MQYHLSYLLKFITFSGHALGFHDDVDTFVCRYQILCSLELSIEDWLVILQVTQWLKVFQSATVAILDTRPTFHMKYL